MSGSPSTQKLQRAQEDLQRHVESSMAQFERQRITPLRRQMFQCGLRCYDPKFDSTRTPEEGHKCWQMCTEPLQRAEATAQQEIERVNQRMQGALQLCQASAEDAARGSSESEFPKFQEQATQCALNVFLDYKREFDAAAQRAHKAVVSNEAPRR